MTPRKFRLYRQAWYRRKKFEARPFVYLTMVASQGYIKDLTVEDLLGIEPQPLEKLRKMSRAEKEQLYMQKEMKLAKAFAERRKNGHEV